jgi:inorganic triphosphatase YgiF
MGLKEGDMSQRHKPATETELKLALTEEVAGVLLRHPALRSPRAGHPERRHEISTYFDTPDYALARRGIGLRVRRTQDRFVQTIKSAGAPGVAAERGEWEWKIDGEQPDLGRLAGTPARELIAADLAAQIRPAFVSDIDRTTWRLHLDGSVAEAALDHGCIRAGDRSTPVLEFELELKQGEPGPLYRLALELHKAAPLRLEFDSKAARGLRLATGAGRQAAKSQPPGPQRDDNAAQAFRTLMLGHLGQLLANEAAAREGQVEGVHQMRIAVRRIRSTLVLFSPVLDRSIACRFTDELRRLGQVMGSARDWDVFCAKILPDAVATEAGCDSSWEGLLRSLAEDRRLAGHAALVRELDRPAFTALVLGLAAWCEDGALHPHVLAPAGADRALRELWPALVRRLVRKVEKRGKDLATLPDSDRHAFRKSLKKLRYALEDLAPLLPAETAAAYLKRGKKLLKLLGQANDAVAGATLARSLAEVGRPDLAPALGLFERHLHAVRDHALQRLAKRWHALRNEAPFWDSAA